MKKKTKTTMLLSDLLDLRRIFRRYEMVKKVKVAYFIARNLTITEDFEKDYLKVTKATPAMLEFEKEKEKLVKEYAVRDDKNSPVRVPVVGAPGSWQYTLADEAAYEKAFLKFKEDEDQKQALDDQEGINEKRKELLDIEHELAFYSMPFSELPEDKNGEIEIMAADLAVLMKYAIIVDDV